MEILHAYLLVHDDLMDEDALRRGGPSLHQQYTELPLAPSPLKPSTYGTAMAIIAGDLACWMALQALTHLPFPEERRLRAISKLSEIFLQVGYGQWLDILASGESPFGEPEAMLVNRLKTARYTIEAPLYLGGLLAGASEEELQALADYSRHLGQAFQLQDDLLGLYGSEEQLGKPVGSDLRQGKRNLLIIKALEKASEEDAARLRSTLGNAHLTAAQLEEVRSIVARSGSLEYSRDLVQSWVRQAQAALPSNLRPEGREFLRGIADYLAHRDL